MCEPHRLLYAPLARACSSPRWRELVARAYYNSLYNQCAPHFGKLSEFDKVLSFGASRTGFYRSLILRLSFAYPSSHTRLCQLADFPSLKVRWECTPHTLANFQSLTKFYPSVRAARAFIYLNEQSVLCPVQLRTQCVPNWIHSIELPQNFSCLTEKPLSAKITKKLTIKIFSPHPQFKIQNPKFKITSPPIQNSKFKILKVLKTMLISIFVIRRCYSFIA